MQKSVIKVRASSWGALFDCAYKWEGEQLLGYRKPSSPRALLGTAIHRATAAYDTEVMNQSGLRPDDVAEVLVASLRVPGEEVDWSADDLTIKQAENIGLTLYSMYCREISPHYQFTAIELEVNPLEIDCGDDLIVKLTGTLDRSRAWTKEGQIGISDIKTGKRAVEKGKAKTKGFKAQLGTYELLYEYTTGVATSHDAEVIGLKTAGKPEIATGKIIQAKQLLIGDHDTPGLMEHAAQMFKTGLFPPNPSTFLCDSRYCARWDYCKYHD